MEGAGSLRKKGYGEEGLPVASLEGGSAAKLKALPRNRGGLGAAHARGRDAVLPRAAVFSVAGETDCLGAPASPAVPRVSRITSGGPAVAWVTGAGFRWLF